MGPLTYKVFNIYFSIRCGTYNSHLHTTDPSYERLTMKHRHHNCPKRKVRKKRENVSLNKKTVKKEWLFIRMMIQPWSNSQKRGQTTQKMHETNQPC